MKPDILAVDRGEQVSAMEPTVLGEGYRFRIRAADLAFDLAQRSASFKSSLPQSLVGSLADLVRAMNCYYSNLIEGHDTHPVDIERALKNDYSGDARKRDLQLEARAHIEVQRWIDGGGLGGRNVFSGGAVCEIHRRFCELLPEDLLWVEDPAANERLKVIPGELRRRDVKVGQHVAVSPGALPRFMERFGVVYGRLGKMESVLAAAAAHHRLLWLHPFLDGNGRVARLMSHAQLLGLLDTGAVWSVARGLARNVREYKELLAECDGGASEEALEAFTEFFLRVCLDEVSFMQSLMQPERLRARILLWAEEEVRVGALPGKARLVLQAILYRGELARGEVDSLVGTGERQARRVVAALVDKGVVVSESTRAPLRLAFPAALAGRFMPGLFPEMPS